MRGPGLLTATERLGRALGRPLANGSMGAQSADGGSQVGGLRAAFALVGDGVVMEKVQGVHSGVGRRIADGTVAGVFGGLVFAAIMAALHSDRMWVALKLAAYPFLGIRVMHSGFDAAAVALGVLCHFAVSIMWGIGFALLVEEFSGAAIVALGALWGLVVWLVMFAGILPVVAPKLAEGGGAFGNMVIHVIYGLALAVGLLPFRKESSALHHWWHSRTESAA